MRHKHIRTWFQDRFHATHPVYKYDALPADGFFRLFVLEPGTGREPLRGSLYTVKLDQAPYYEAISYVWGSSDRCIELICDNQQILITGSLSEVLHCIRLPSRSRTLWTDLVCMNQSDLDEKGSQVSLMSKIYRRSNQTLIHIGAQDDGHGGPIQGLLSDIDRSIFANLQQEWDSAPDINNDHPLVDDTRWKSMRHMIETPWFWRGWVVQEAAYARHGVVLWGKHELSWTMIMKTVIWALQRAYLPICQKFDLVISSMHTSCFSVLRWNEVQPFMSEQFWRSLGKFLTTLDSGRNHHLADPRDRIYAFYNLPASDRPDKLQITPNYHDSFFEVCKDLALRYLDVYDDLDLLLYVLHDEEFLTRNFPSWMPLWRPKDYLYEGFASYARRAPLIERQEKGHRFCGGGDNLLVSGLSFATVRMVSVVLSKEQLTFEAIASLWSKVCGVQKNKITVASNGLSMFLAALCSDKSSPGKGESRRHFQDTAAFALEIFHTATDEEKRAIDYHRWETQAGGGNAKRFLSGIQITARNMRFIVTDRGYGIAPAVVREGDECVILRGGKMPFLLRKVDGVGKYKFVGGMFHSSEYEHEHEDTGWHVGRGIVVHTDWNNWDIEEEEFCLI